MSRMRVEQVGDMPDDLAGAMRDAAGAYEAAYTAIGVWVRSCPDGTLTYTGMASGIAKLAGVMLQRIKDDDQRAAATAGAVATLLLNAECNTDQILEVVRSSLEAVALQTTEVAGNA